jgi:hypothetical protein
MSLSETSLCLTLANVLPLSKCWRPLYEQSDARPRQCTDIPSKGQEYIVNPVDKRLSNLGSGDEAIALRGSERFDFVGYDD